MSRRPFVARRLVAVLGALVLAAPLAGDAQSLATASLNVSARIEARTSLQTSAPVLRFHVLDPLVPAMASIDFAAGARAATTDDVRLVIEAVSGHAGVLAITGGPEGTVVGEVASDVTTTAARWTGGGLRSGRLTFSVLGLAPGHYDIPLELRLTIG